MDPSKYAMLTLGLEHVFKLTVRDDNLSGLDVCVRQAIRDKLDVSSTDYFLASGIELWNFLLCSVIDHIKRYAT